MSLVKKNMEYLGTDSLNTIAEINVEISGLKHLIKSAEEYIARLEQSLVLAKYNILEKNDE